MRKCIACGGKELADGRVVSSGVHLFVYGTPMEFQAVGRFRGKSPIVAFACLECGHLELVVDRGRLRSTGKR